MKQLFRNGIKLACLSLVLLNPNTVKASEVVEEMLVVGSQSVPLASFVGVLFGDKVSPKNRLMILKSLHKNKADQGLFKSPLFLKPFSALEEKDFQEVVLTCMTQETKEYLQKNLFALFPKVSGEDVTQNPALKVLQAMGEYETAQLSVNLKELLALDQGLTAEERAGIIAEGHGTVLEKLFPGLYGHEVAPPPGAPFFHRWFYEQKANVTAIEAIIVAQGGKLTAATEAGDRDALQKATATLQFWMMSRYAAKHPMDHALQQGFEDAQLFVFSDDYSHLDLSRHFLRSAAARDQITLLAFGPTFEAASGDAEAQKRIAGEANVWMLKVEMMSLGSMVLNDIIGKGVGAPQEFHNLNVRLANLFLGYVAEPKVLKGVDDPSLSDFHAKLCRHKGEYDAVRDDLEENSFDIPSLLDTTTVTDEVGASAAVAEGSSGAEIMAEANASIAESLDTLGYVEEAAAAYAIKHNDADVAAQAGLIWQVKYLGGLVKSETDPAKLKPILKVLLYIKNQVKGV